MYSILETGSKMGTALQKLYGYLFISFINRYPYIYIYYIYILLGITNGHHRYLSAEIWQRVASSVEK